jgi:hypothetical protein
MLCVPTISLFDNIATEFVKTGFLYRYNNYNCYSLIQNRQQLNVFSISIIPLYDIHKKIVFWIRIEIPIKNSKYTYVTKFHINNVEEAKFFLLSHLNWFDENC